MKFNIRALAITAGLMAGLVVLFVELANLVWPGYGQPLLGLAASVYPGYHPGTGVASVVIGTLYGLADGAIGGALFGWLYNKTSG